MNESNLIKSYINNNKLNIEKIMENYTPYIYTIIKNKSSELTEEDVEEIILIIFNYIGKSYIAKILEIENINDFYIKDLGESLGLDSARPLYIKFKISIDKYEKYNLTYIDTALDDNVYEGEITNKKQKISDKYYICYYEKVIYDNKQKVEFRKIKYNRLLLKANSIILLLIICAFILKKRKLNNSKLER